MDIKIIFDEYLLQSNKLTLAQRTIRQITEDEVKSLSEKKKKKEELSKEKDPSHGTNYFLIPDALTGESIRHNTIHNTYNKQIEFVYLHKNKQYQWILSESYEIFREFLFKSYAYLGFVDKNIWPLKDYGNIILNDLKSQEFDFFYRAAKIKKDAPDSILKIYRKIFPEYEKLELTNKITPNLRLELNLIEEFRHIIVHNSGVSFDKNDSIQKILKKAGLYNNGKHKQEDIDYISSFFRFKEFPNTICLLEAEIENEPNKFPNRRKDVLHDLIDYLIATANAIYLEIENMNTRR